MSIPEPIILSSSMTKSRTYFCHARWQGRRTCPRCSFRYLYRLSDERYACKRCKYKFGEFTGTYLGQIRLPLNEVAHLLYLFSLGVPSFRARRYSSASIKSMQRIFTVFREAIYTETINELRQLSGDIELDESLFGGHRKGKRGWGAAGKILVFGLYKRNGRVLTFPVKGRGKGTLLPLIERYTTPGSLYYTDDWHAYASLRVRGGHVVVTKQKGRPHGRNHINGIEGFWSYAKNWFYQYRGVPKHNFPLYLKEIEFRFNHREEDIFHLISNLVVKSVPDVT